MQDDWLAALQPGDEVVIDSSSPYHRVALGRVLRRTPSGRIVVKYGNGSLAFMPNGHEYGGNDWSRACLSPATTEAREQIERAALLDTISTAASDECRLRALPLATLRQIAALLESTEEGGRDAGNVHG